MSEQKQENPQAGLFLIGQVNAKTSRVYKNGEEHFFLSVVAPGDDVMYRVEAKPQVWGSFKEGDTFKARVVGSAFNNQITYSLR